MFFRRHCGKEVRFSRPWRVAKRRKGAQKTITSTGFFPLLPKPAVAVGKFASVPGKYWTGCPPADKDKRFKCTVIEFVGVHDFGEARMGSRTRATASSSSPARAPSRMTMARWTPRASRSGRPLASTPPPTSRPTSRFSSATCSSSARVSQREARRSWQICTRTTLACSTPLETKRARAGSGCQPRGDLIVDQQRASRVHQPCPQDIQDIRD